MRAISLSFAVALLAIGCEVAPGDASVIVEVRTDYVPLVEFDRVVTRFYEGGSDDAAREIDFASPAELDSNAYGDGVRVAEAEGLLAGQLVVEVELLLGEERAAVRRLQVTAAGTTAVTVPLTRSCESVVCGGEERSACLAGQCVTPECADGTGECDFETLPLAEYPRAFLASTCARLRSCTGGAFDLTFEGLDCVEVVGPAFEDTVVQQIVAAIDRGTLGYDPRLARACTEAARAVSCEASFLSLDIGECYDALRASPDQTECRVDPECGRDRYCDTTSACPGSCAPRKGEGEPCLDQAMCRYGLNCRGPAGASVCVRLAETGEPCGLDAGVCSADHFCLGVRSLLDEPGVCQPISELFVAREGESCSVIEGPFCASGLSCALDTLDAGTCVAHPVSPGGPCRVSFPDVCPAGESCVRSGGTTSGSCQPLPRDGEACVGDFAVIRCAPGHRCVDGLCRASRRLGEACASGDDCASRQCEDGACTSPECVVRGF